MAHLKTSLPFLFFLIILGACNSTQEVSLPAKIGGKELILEKENDSQTKVPIAFIYTFSKSRLFRLTGGGELLESGTYKYHADPISSKATISFEYSENKETVTYLAHLNFSSSSSGTWRISEASKQNIHPHEEGTFTFVIKGKNGASDQESQ